MMFRLGTLATLIGMTLAAFVAPAQAQTEKQTIYLNAKIATMDPKQPTASAVAVQGETILGVGTRAQMRALTGPGADIVDLAGATVLPGFIDPHSHFLGYAFYINPRWIDVSNVNVYFKPLPGDGRCKTPKNPQLCFIPVKTQDDVMARLRDAAAKERQRPIRRRIGVYAFNYDASRLGHSAECSGQETNVGFRCPNLEDGQTRVTLDAVADEFPVYVAGQSGHISYANTRALEALGICGVANAPEANCYQPRTYRQRQIILANQGILVEDLALYADAHFDGLIASQDEVEVLAAIATGINTYADHGFTLLQEGAASYGDAKLYKKLTEIVRDLPVTVALYVYDVEEKTTEFKLTIQMAERIKQLLQNTPDVFIGGLKTFVDGGLPVYTAQLSQPFHEVFPPFTDPAFSQPFKGLHDVSLEELKDRLRAAHRAGYQLLVHELGDRSAKVVARAMTEVDAAAPTRLHDIMLHGPMVSADVLDKLKALDNPISFLTQDLYFWGQPLCNQILGYNFLKQFPPYPAASAKARGLTVTMHTDSPVTPPSPLFSIWVAKTRSVQQMPWYPNRNDRCEPVLAASESLSIADGIEAFTRDAAKQYGLLGERGTITPGKVADFVFLSDNPLEMEDRPNDLRNVRVLGTVHDGRYRANPHADEAPIWPADL